MYIFFGISNGKNSKKSYENKFYAIYKFIGYAFSVLAS